MLPLALRNALLAGNFWYQRYLGDRDVVQLIPMALDKVHHDMVVNNVLSETRIRWHASGVRGCCEDEVPYFLRRVQKWLFCG